MTPPTRALGRGEFIALMAMMLATVAFSIDAMLPALPAIGAALGVVAENSRQWVITAYLGTSAVAVVVAGPVVDAIGARAMPGGGRVFIRPEVTTHTSIGAQSNQNDNLTHSTVQRSAYSGL